MYNVFFYLQKQLTFRTTLVQLKTQNLVFSLKTKKHDNILAKELHLIYEDFSNY